MSARRLSHLALGVFAAALVLLAPAGRAADADADAEAQLNQLLKARYEAAMKALELEEALLDAGLTTMGVVATTMRDVRDALLELPVPPAERVKVFSDYVARARKLEDRLAKRVEAGLGRPLDVVRGRYLRLDAEICLLRAKRAAAIAP